MRTPELPAGAPIGERLHGIKAEWDERAARVRDAQEARADQAAASTYVNTKSEVGQWWKMPCCACQRCSVDEALAASSSPTLPL